MIRENSTGTANTEVTKATSEVTEIQIEGPAAALGRVFVGGTRKFMRATSRSLLKQFSYPHAKPARGRVSVLHPKLHDLEVAVVTSGNHPPKHNP